MCPSSVLQQDAHGHAWILAIQKLGWWNGDIEATSGLLNGLLSSGGQSTCWLKKTLDLDDQNPGILTSPSRDAISQAIDLGISIRDHWPRTWSTIIDQWLGPRFYLTSAVNFAASERYAGIACSHIGRHGCHLPDWPSRLDAALQHCHRNELRPLIARHTTLSDPLRQFSQRAELRTLAVNVDLRQTYASEWIIEKLKQITGSWSGEFSNARLSDFMLDALELSPPIDQPIHGLEKYPMQDRVVASLADWMAILYAREPGTIRDLTLRRLGEAAFPMASTYCMIELESKKANQPTLLDRGGVGWLMPQRHSTKMTRSHRYDPNPSKVPFSQSICMPLTALNNMKGDSDDWEYLAHCTRSGIGPMPNESIEQYLDRVWTSGHIKELSPFETLIQILNEGRLRANSRWTRTHEPCISFSAVPLRILLSRRRFQSHLGRWDWEPYGLLFRRAALVELGARPVIYGAEADFKSLSAIDQPYFQPYGKVNKRTQQDWTAEREWRMIGDLQFQQLPQGAMMLFVQTKSQAENLSRCYSIPVIWTEGCYNGADG